jgi:glycosyltransferase involved in cell wall biosynthesis
MTEQMYLGGAETHLVTLCTALIARGHQIYVWVVNCLGPWRALIRRTGAVMVDSPGQAGMVDIIHLQVWGPTNWRALEWQKESGLPLVATFHGLDRTGLAKLKTEAELICVSAAVRQELDLPTATVVENGVDLEKFVFSGLPFNRKVAWLGRMDGPRWLTLEMLFRGFEAAGVSCKAAGAFLKSGMMRRLRQYQTVEWHGAVFDVPGFLAEVDVVFTTSRGIREAMAMGKIAVIANNIWYGGVVKPETAERLRHNSFMAWQDRPLLPETVAADLKDLYQDPAKMEKLSKWGAQYARQEFSATQMAIRTEAVYRRALDRQP